MPFPQPEGITCQKQTLRGQESFEKLKIGFHYHYIFYIPNKVKWIILVYSTHLFESSVALVTQAISFKTCLSKGATYGERPYANSVVCMGKTFY